MLKNITSLGGTKMSLRTKLALQDVQVEVRESSLVSCETRHEHHLLLRSWQATQCVLSGLFEWSCTELQQYSLEYPPNAFSYTETMIITHV